MKIKPDTTLVEYFYHWERTTPDRIFLRQPFGDTWLDFTWQQAGEQARKLAAYLHSLGLPPKSRIGLVSKNCAEWFISDIAIMLSGHVSVPFYPTLTAEQLEQVVVHSGCNVLLVGKLDNWNAMKAGVPNGVICVSFPTYNPDPAHVQWADVMTSQIPFSDSPLPSPDELMTIVYTSGTTGNPKGVMLTFGGFALVLHSLKEFVPIEVPAIRLLSYLPLCHMAERGILANMALATGATVHFTESIDTFSKNLAAVQPTHFGSVPRIWVKFQQGILAKMPQKRLDLLLRIPILSGIVKKKIRTTLGLGQVQFIGVGAAPMPVSLMLWFRRLGIHMQEIYGMTETTSTISVMPRNGIKDGTVGKALATVTVKIDPDTGEICVKSPHNMLGYYNEPAMTAETLGTDGWLHTGDKGEVDAEGYLRITGRVKEMYKTSKGEYVAPSQIELRFADNALIEQVCVVGQGLPQPVALIVLSESARAEDKTIVAESLRLTHQSVNKILKPYERVQKIVVVQEPWTVENNRMTPTMKLKRKEVEKAFASRIEGWYEHKDDFIWEM
ncbi:AMP-binding protein [Spirosoma montaniterrae]|uniref:AMP-dependent synthetase n=1 Tax=Spirosoma montaniterrae TaxID=1178516 RepID=A0A1P9X1G3_9BACT|nr:AMP-binding protein [Spirosoma montaniterrae]AQG81443.1 AMP-dependent synthetase [Spirosoma montaniterrae]